MKHILILNPSFYEDGKLVKSKHARWLPLSIPILYGLLSKYNYDISVCNEFIEEVSDFHKFDYVFISCNDRKISRLAKILKDKSLSNVPVVIGGNFEESDLRQIDDFSLPDNCICIKGYAEKIIPIIISSGIQKHLFNDSTELYRIKPHDIAVSNYAFFDKKEYDSNSRLYIESSRGCSMRCKFCDIFKYHPKRIIRSKDDIASNIISNINETGVREFHFTDSNIELGRKYGKNLINILRLLPISISWGASTDINGITKGLLKEAAKSGCIHLNFGVESLIPENLHTVGKKWIYKNNLKQKVREIIKNCNSNGIAQNIHLILGLDYDTEENIMETVEWLIECKAIFVEFHILDPGFDTQAYNELERQGRIIGNNETMTIYQPKNMSYPELIDIYKRALEVFYSHSSIAYRCGNNGYLKKRNLQIYESSKNSEVF